MLAPVGWDPVRRPGSRLFDRTVARRRQVGPLGVVFGPVVPEPRLSRLIGLDYVVPGALVVGRCVLRGGRIAAPDVAAPSATPQVHPPTPAGVALEATVPGGRYYRVNPIDLAHLGRSLLVPLVQPHATGP